MAFPLDKLSVVMIGKDASRYLDEALGAVAGVADEVVYVDTGSSDDSAGIARRAGARVYDFPWCDDFSRAKNFALEQARGGWVLSVDTDEVLCTPNAREILDAAMAGAHHPAYILYQDNLYDSGAIKPNPVARLFRNDPRIRFRNPVHECVSESVLAHFPGAGLGVLGLHLRHYGYLGANMAAKRERNLALLRKWVAAEPDHPFAAFNLGNTLLDLGRAEEGLRWLRKTLAHFADRQARATAPYVTHFMVAYHRALLACGQPDEAARFAALADEWLREGAGWPRRA